MPGDKAYGIITTIAYFCDGLVLSCVVCSDIICSVCLSSLLDPQTCAYVMIKIPPAMGHIRALAWTDAIQLYDVYLWTEKVRWHKVGTQLVQKSTDWHQSI
jgi:hypothetical protein